MEAAAESMKELELKDTKVVSAILSDVCVCVHRSERCRLQLHQLSSPSKAVDAFAFVLVALLL